MIPDDITRPSSVKSFVKYGEAYSSGEKTRSDHEYLFDKALNQGIFFPLHKADLRSDNHGMEEIAQFMVFHIHFFFLQKHIHHARVIPQTFAAGGIQIYRWEVSQIAQKRRDIGAVDGQIATVMIDDLVGTEHDAIVGFPGALIVAVSIMQKLEYRRAGNDAAGEGKPLRPQLVGEGKHQIITCGFAHQNYMIASSSR